MQKGANATPMAKSKHVEAHVTTAAGTTILMKGAKEDIGDLLAIFSGQPTGGRTGTVRPAAHAPQGNFAGVAELDANGSVQIVVTDLKAKNAMDAAKRLIYITLLARREMLSEKKTERGLINKVLKSYNLYDGNTRNIIPRDRALVSEGRKYVMLSGAATPIAWEFVRAVQDTTSAGSWRPTGSKKRRRRVKRKASVK